MPGTNLGTAYVQIVPSAQGISGSISNVMSGEASVAGEKTGGLFSKVFSSKVVKGFAIAGTAIAAGVGIGTAALKKGITETAAYGDNVDKMSQKIGFSSEAYQKWDYVLQRAGTDIGKLGPVMKTLSNQATSNSAAFKELGISQEDLANMSPDQLFGETVKKLSEMENVTERTALASKLLGRGATELGPLFNEGSEAIEEQMELAEKYGMIMPEETVKASAAFQDSVTTMQMTMTGLKNRMMGELLPAATKVTDGLGKMFAGDMSGADDVAQGIREIAAKIITMAPVVWNAAKKIGGELLKGIMSHSDDVGQKAVEIVGKLLTGLINHLPQILAAGVKLISGLAKGLAKALPQVLAAVKKIGTQIVTGLGSKIWGKVKAAANGIKERFMSPLNTIKERVKAVANSIKERFLAPIRSAKEKVKSIIDKIKGYFPINVGNLMKGIKLPHFSLKWESKDFGPLGTIKYPTGISFDGWWAKGGVFSSPSIIGVGEAGPEAVVPLDKFWSKLDKIQGGQNIVININGANADPKQIAEEVKRTLIRETNQRRLAWQ